MYDDVVKVLTGHTTFDNALVQDDYPYGRHRTQRKAWVETAEKGAKRGQQRFVTCTMNPKTGRWNKPKAGTYSDVIVLYLNSDEHVKMAVLHLHSSREDVAVFVEMFGEHLTPHQWSAIRLICAYYKVSQRIEWRICEPGEKARSIEEQGKIIAGLVAQELRTQAAR